MDYGVESACSPPLTRRLRIQTAARHFNVSIRVLNEYAQQGLLIPLISSRGACYFTERDGLWVKTISQLLNEGHLTFEGIRERLARCACWQIRHCDFHSRGRCPLTSDPTKPCWVNRSMCTILCSYPCYACRVYRSAPTCDSLKELLRPGFASRQGPD